MLEIKAVAVVVVLTMLVIMTTITIMINAFFLLPVAVSVVSVEELY